MLLLKYHLQEVMKKIYTVVYALTAQLSNIPLLDVKMISTYFSKLNIIKTFFVFYTAACH